MVPVVKLALIGGGGVRAPLFVRSALARAGRLGLTELCLMDCEPRQLELFGAIARELGRRSGAKTSITTTTDARTALAGADYVVTTIRPGGTAGRIADERIALEIGVLGQETTGAGGFAMAMRSIPAILDYAALMAELCPKAWLINFTNPAGLVTQALRDAGFERTIGICDSANGAQRAIAGWLGRPEAEVVTDLFGLNHLSFTTTALVDGEDVLARALADDRFLDTTEQRVFERDLVRRHGLWFNEYLYYYYYAEKALAALAGGPTRGEEIETMNAGLFARLASVDIARDPGAALDIYFAYEHRRSASYMASARREGTRTDEALSDSPGGEGYAGVALAIIEALEGGPALRTGLNVPNEGAISDFRAGDVVETSCLVDASGIRPLPFGAMPERQSYLVQSVKNYERLTVAAIAAKSRDLAIEALAAHPLVVSYSRARPLVARYLEAHAAFTGEWGR